MTVITRDRVRGTRSSLAVKAPCKVSTTGNITLAGQQTIDGVVVSDGDRVLVRVQDNAAENGIYEVRQITNQAWVRAGDWSSDNDVTTGTRVYVQQGDVASGEYYVSTAAPIQVGTTDVSIDAYTNVGTGVSSVDGNTGAITAAQIKTAYESNSDTNAFTNALKGYVDTIAGVSGDGQFIVSSAPATITWESGATARASMGVYSTTEVDSAIAAAITAESLEIAGDSGTGEIDLDSESLTLSGDDWISTTVSGSEVTFSTSVYVYDTVADLLASTRAYSEGDVISTSDGHSYTVAASGATDHLLTTAGSAKLYVNPSADGTYSLLAMGVATDGSADVGDELEALGQYIVDNRGGTLRLPPGELLIENAVSITMPSFNDPNHDGIESFNLIGAGRGSTKLYIDADLTASWAVTITRAYNRQRCHASDFTFVPLAAKTGTPNMGALYFASTWTTASGGWGVQHTHQCTIFNVNIENEDVTGDTGYISNGFRIDWAWHPKVLWCFVKTQTQWARTDNEFASGNGIQFYGCYLAEVQASHVNGRWTRAIYCWGDNNSGGELDQDFEGFKVWFTTIDGEPATCIELDHLNQSYREEWPKEVGCDIWANHIDPAIQGLVVRHHEDIRVIGNKFYLDQSGLALDYNYNVSRMITFEAVSDATVTGNNYIQGGKYNGTDITYGSNLATRPTGNSGAFDTAVDGADTVIEVTFTTPGTAPSATPGQVIYESGGASIGIALVLQDDMTLGLYIGSGGTSPKLETADALDTSTQYNCVVEIDQTNEEVRLHYKKGADEQYFYKGRRPEAILEGFTETDISGTDGCGVGQINSVCGGFTGTASGTTTFQGTIDTNVDVWALGDKTSECIFLDIDCREVLIQGERFGSDGVGIHSRSAGSTIKIGPNHWGEQFGSDVDNTREPTVKYLDYSGTSFVGTEVTSLDVGSNDDYPGVVSVYGGAATEDGGELNIYNPADEDTDVDYWRIATDGFQGFGFYRRGGTSGDPSAGDFVIQKDGKLFLAYNQGEAQIGATGVSETHLRLEGEVTYANLPTTRRATGSVCLLSDGADGLSVGAPVEAGSGSATHLIWYDGSNWRVLGGTQPAAAWSAHADNPKSSTSGTALTFTGIPSWAQELRLSINGVSMDGSAQMQVRIGDGTTPSTAGYIGRVTSVTGGGTAYTGGFALTRASNFGASNTAYGDAILNKASTGNRWNMQASIARGDGGVLWNSGGTYNSTGTADRLSITSTSTAAFDAGSISLFYR